MLYRTNPAPDYRKQVEVEAAFIRHALLPGKRIAGEAALRLMDEHLADRDYFVGRSLTLADIGLYAYTHVAEEGGFDLGAYPYVQAWLDRIAGQPGYIGIEA